MMIFFTIRPASGPSVLIQPSQVLLVKISPAKATAPASLTCILR